MTASLPSDGKAKPIGMAEMNQIFDIVDDLEISREAIQVDLLPGGEGTMEKLANGKFHFVLPEGDSLEGWLQELREWLTRHKEPDGVSQSLEGSNE